MVFQIWRTEPVRADEEGCECLPMCVELFEDFAQDHDHGPLGVTDGDEVWEYSEFCASACAVHAAESG